MRKCAGVSTSRSLGSEESGVSGPELKIPFICVMTVEKLSKYLIKRDVNDV